ncbi:hypothetical protein [Intrasporangium sp. YIM S08009]|uniref:hypothetical protein n=1 Tax=Intrasporangium zincisolvens TaxID=3080018 RepID=UPI002B060449|nr:hypothetical protein [Intrasporangium sp. YIM S08009]
MDESRHTPEPHLDPDEPTDPTHDTLDVDTELDERVRGLLAAPAPDAGPMPDAVADRIAAALAQEARLRVDRGPLADASAPAGPHDEHATVLEMRRPQRRHRPYYLAAAVAAAALVVAAGASALHLTKRPNSTAVIGGGFTSSTPATSPATTPSTGDSGVHIQLGRTAYAAATLGAQARELLDHPRAPLRPGAAEAPAIGPIGTDVGLASCLEGLGVAAPAPSAVSADLATFEGRPAAVVVVTRDGASSAWAVERSCSAQAPGVLHPETPVP